MNEPKPGPRCMMWVDGVGGYLTCFSDIVRIGQAISGSRVEVPVIGDLSRQHVQIQRQGEGYVIEPHGPTWIDERAIESIHNLADGDEIRLGRSFRLRFRMPHPLSRTARLEFLSDHRTQPSSDGILLMAGSCILGSAPSSHVVCRSWERDVVLVRHGQELICHAGRPIEIDGQTAAGRGRVSLGSTVRGDDFCLSLERFD